MYTTTEQQKEVINEKINNSVFLFNYKGKKPVKQLYTVNMQEPVKVGGLAQEGFRLSFFPEVKSSNSVITYTNILKVLKYGTLEGSTNDIFNSITLLKKSS